MGGFWEPLSGYAVQWIAPALGARFIVVSTSRASDELNNHRAPEAAKLFFYDVNEARIVREIVPIPKGRTTGLIMEVGPGRLLGLTVATVDPGKPGADVLYGLDVATGEVLFSKTLPSVLTIMALGRTGWIRHTSTWICSEVLTTSSYGRT